MRDFIALRPVVGIAGLFAVVMLGLALMLAADQTAFIVPEPSATAEELFRALKSSRDAAAYDLLSRELQRGMSVDDLRVIDRRLQQTNGGISTVEAEGVAEQPQRATVQIRVRFNQRREEVVEIPLVNEQHQWKVASLDPVRKLEGL